MDKSFKTRCSLIKVRTKVISSSSFRNWSSLYVTTLTASVRINQTLPKTMNFFGVRAPSNNNCLGNPQDCHINLNSEQSLQVHSKCTEDFSTFLYEVLLFLTSFDSASRTFLSSSSNGQHFAQQRSVGFAPHKFA